jgi:import inner membrane translocase subunit TIM8
MSQPEFSENDQRELGQVKEEAEWIFKNIYSNHKKKFLEAEQAKARVQQTVHSMTDTCWVRQSERHFRSLLTLFYRINAFPR